MKIDLVGPSRRGLALGLNESAGYLGVALAAFATGALAATFAPRTVVWVGAAHRRHRLARRRSSSSATPAPHVELEQRDHGGGADRQTLRQAFAPRHVRHPVLRACSQAGLVNNLNDALAWGLVPLYLAANGASVTEIGVVAAVYPAVWGVRPAPDRLALRPHRPQAADRRRDARPGRSARAPRRRRRCLRPALLAAILLGLGTALVYPTLIAAVSDAVQPVERAPAVGVYRFWRDFGFVAGALISGLVADTLGAGKAIAIVAALTAASGLWVAATRWSAHPRLSAEPMADIGNHA